MHILLKTIYFVETELAEIENLNRLMIKGELELENCQRDALPVWL